MSLLSRPGLSLGKMLLCLALFNFLSPMLSLRIRSTLVPLAVSVCECDHINDGLKGINV